MVGAIYLDSNYSSAKKATVLFFETLISNSLLLKDSKTRLQEYLHSKHIPLPIYSTHKSSKKSYKYLVECLIPSKNIKESLFTNKVKTAQQKLAQIILNKLNEEKVRVLILGKSNVGKSSLINCLVKEHNALVSSKLHSTRLSTFHEFNNEDYEVQLVDTPGVSISDGNLLSQAMKRNAIRFMTNSDMIIIG